MPLTRERDGIFRGRRSNHESWYIVDPGAGSDVDATIRGWRSHYAPTNKPGWQRVVRGLVFFLTWGAITAGGVAIASLIPILNGAGQVALVVVLFIAGLVCAGLMLLWVFPYREVKPLGDLSVVGIPSPVAEWVGDHMRADDLWNLVTAYRDVEEVQTLIELIGVEWWLESGKPRPDNAIEKLVEPILRDEWEKRRRHLEMVGAELGFQLTADMFADPRPMAEYRES